MSDPNFEQEGFMHDPDASILKDALEKSRKVLESGIGSLPPADILEALVHYCIETGHNKDALLIADALLSYEPFSADAWHAKSVAEANNENYVAAKQSIIKALSLNPSDASIQITHAMLANQLGDSEQALLIYTSLLKVYPGNDEVFYGMAQLHEKAGRYHEAIKILKFLLNSEDFKKNALSDLGYCYDCLLDYTHSLFYYEEYLKIEPFDNTAWFNKAVVLCHLERFNEAVESYDFALAIKEDFAGAWYNRGNALGSIGKISEAIESYQQSLLYEPEDTSTWHNLASSLEETGEFKDAIHAFTMALYHDENHCESYYGRGSCYDALEQYTEALKDYDKALELFSEYTDVWYAKADVLFNIQDIDGSLDCYQIALKLNPEDNECRLDYGLTLAESKQFDKAEEQFLHLIHHNAEWYAAYYELAKIKHIQNNEIEAKELLKKAISLEKTKVEEMKSDFFLYCTNNQLIDLFSHII